MSSRKNISLITGTLVSQIANGISSAWFVKANIEKLREGINRPIILKEVRSLVVLTDKEAVDYSAAQANAGIKKHRRHTCRLFTHIDSSKLDQAKKRDLVLNRFIMRS